MQQILCLLAVECAVAQVNEHQVHVGATGEHRDTGLGDILTGEPVGEDLGTGQSAALTLGELLGAGDLEGNGLGRDHMHERAALLTGEDGRVELLGPFLFGQDETRARTAECLVHGRGHHVRMRDG